MKVFRTRKTDVLVVGAGPTGLLTALTLAMRGVDVHVVDEQWRPAAHSYALALHASTLERLQEFGVTDALVGAGRPLERVALYDGAERRVELDLTHLSERFPFLLVTPQSAFERVLVQALEEAGVRVEWNRRVTDLERRDDRVLARIDRLSKTSTGYAAATTEWVVDGTSKLAPRYVVGADGVRSTVRRCLRTDYEEAGESEHFAVFEIETGFDPGPELRLALGPDHGDVLWPLPDGRVRFSFRLPEAAIRTPEREKSRVGIQVGGRTYPRFSEERLAELLAERMPWFDGEVRALRWSLAIRFDRRLTRDFGRDALWLVGDAGHVTSPVGMQSMNVGLREAWDLGSAIADSLDRGRAADTLAAYASERRKEWRSLLGLEGGLELAPANEWLRPFAKRLPPLLPASGKHLEALLTRL